MRTIRGRVKELSRLPPKVSFGYLAEPYDGIGQYVMVTLAKSSTAAAFKARVAAGDFGGGRTFPAGTKVPVFSNRGQLEILLGNHPDCIRRWQLPIEILIRGKITHNNASDVNLELQVDLLQGLWTPATPWGLGSYAGIYLFDGALTTPQFYLDMQGGGSVTSGSNHWLNQPSTEPQVFGGSSADGLNFFLRYQIQQFRVDGKAWLATDPEPDWQYYMEDSGQTKPFNPDQDHTLYVLTNSTRFPSDIAIDYIHILKGYGKTPFLVDGFDRSASNGWSGSTSVPDKDWVAADLSSIDQYLIDGQYGIWRRLVDLDDFSNVMYLQLPNGIGCKAGKGLPSDAVDLFCGETYTRTVVGGHGDCEWGGTWDTSPTIYNPSTVEVNGNEAVFLSTSFMDSIGADPDAVVALPQPATLPAELLIKLRFITGTHSTYDGVNGTVQYKLDIIGSTSGTRSTVQLQLNIGPTWPPTDLSLIVGRRVDSFIPADQQSFHHEIEDAPDKDLLLRVRIESDRVKARIWVLGDTEPSTWREATAGGGSMDGSDIQTFIHGISGFDDDVPLDEFEEFVRIDSIELVEGINCG